VALAHRGLPPAKSYQVLCPIWQGIIGFDNGNVHVRNPLKENGSRHKLVDHFAR
jgi:hypothetical protein